MKFNKNLIAYLALGAVCLIWGTTYLALRVGVTQFPPFLFSAIRFLIAGPLLIGFMLTVGKVKFPSKEIMMHQAISGICMAALGVGVIGWVETQVSSGLAAIICSVMPIWVILINLFVTGDERPTFPILLGLVVCTSGIVMIFGEHLPEFSDPRYSIKIAVAFASNLCWAFGTVWIKKNNQDSNPFLNAGLQMFFGGVFLVPMSLAFDEYSTIQWSGEIVGSLIYLILVGSILAYCCYSYAIKKLPMTIVSLYAYINPVVAVILGWVLLNEKFNLRIAIAILVTLAGIYIVNRGFQLKNLWREQVQRFKAL